jgi:hypothetical protein
MTAPEASTMTHDNPIEPRENDSADDASDSGDQDALAHELDADELPAYVGGTLAYRAWLRT